MFAWFAETFAPAAPPAPDPDREALDRLVTARRLLVRLATSRRVWVIPAVPGDARRCLIRSFYFD
jgi:hypothetical protein